MKLTRFTLSSGIAQRIKVNMDIYQFKALLEKDKKFPIYVFFGEEDFFINEAYSAVKVHSLTGYRPKPVSGRV